jgi:hypothetical protein
MYVYIYICVYIYGKFAKFSGNLHAIVRCTRNTTGYEPLEKGFCNDRLRALGERVLQLGGLQKDDRLRALGKTTGYEPLVRARSNASSAPARSGIQGVFRVKEFLIVSMYLSVNLSIYLSV